MLPMSVKDNLTLAVLHKISKAGVVRRRQEISLVADVAERLQIRPVTPDSKRSEPCQEAISRKS